MSALTFLLSIERGLVSILLTVVFLFSVSIARASSDLPAEDPTRTWIGTEYADAIFTEFQRRNPQTPLVIDPQDLANIQLEWDSKQLGLRAVAEKFVQQWKDTEKIVDGAPLGWRERLIHSVKNALPAGISQLTHQLEFGERVEVNRKKQEVSLERQLALWIFEQPEGSVAPHELMVRALELTGGRVVAAWATIWNLTRGNWEKASLRGYGKLTRHMISLTGEAHLWRGGAHYIVLPESEWKEVDSTIYEFVRDPVTNEKKVNDSGRYEMTKQPNRAVKKLKMVITKRGDEYSYLYHRVGIELYSMVLAKMSGSARVGRALGTAGAMGEFFKYTQTAGLRAERKKRVRNDIYGAESGARLFDLVEGKTRPRNAGPVKASNYLKSQPTRYAQSYRAHLGQPSEYVGSAIDPKFWADKMSWEELRLRFEYAVTVDSVIFNSIILTSTGDYERLHRGLAEYIQRGAFDPQLNLWMKTWKEQAGVLPKVPDVTVDLDKDVVSNYEFLREFVGVEHDPSALHARIGAQIDRALGVAEERSFALKNVGAKRQEYRAANQCRELFLGR